MKAKSLLSESDETGKPLLRKVVGRISKQQGGALLMVELVELYHFLNIFYDCTKHCYCI